jgi:hypothetical protein
MTRGVDSAPSGREGPVRTCVGCRERAAKAELLRLVVDLAARTGDEPVRVVPDPAGRRPGRGAHVHPRPECLDLAVRRRAFARAFRLAGPFDVGEVRRVVGQQVGPTPSQQSRSTPEGGDEAMSAR